VAKSYFDAMGIIPPSEKFKIAPKYHGIAMQAYYANRYRGTSRFLTLSKSHFQLVSSASRLT
jgi:hypothetical protein